MLLELFMGLLDFVFVEIYVLFMFEFHLVDFVFFLLDKGFVVVFLDSNIKKTINKYLLLEIKYLRILVLIIFLVFLYDHIELLVFFFQSY